MSWLMLLLLLLLLLMSLNWFLCSPKIKLFVLLFSPYLGGEGVWNLDDVGFWFLSWSCGLLIAKNLHLHLRKPSTWRWIVLYSERNLILSETSMVGVQTWKMLRVVYKVWWTDCFSGNRGKFLSRQSYALSLIFQKSWTINLFLNDHVYSQSSRMPVTKWNNLKHLTYVSLSPKQEQSTTYLSSGFINSTKSFSIISHQ